MLAGYAGPVAAAALAGGSDGAGRDQARGRSPAAADAGRLRPRHRRRLGAGGRHRRTGVIVDGKLDGIRLQAHRDGDDVRLFTRSLDDITDRLPEVVEAVLALPVQPLVIDGEAIALDAAGRPRPFQETASRTMSSTGVDRAARRGAGHALLLRPPPRRRPGPARAARPPSGSPGSPQLVPERGLVPRHHRRPRPRRPPSSSTGSSRDGHEGVVVKSPVSALCRRPPRRRVGQGQAAAHPRPRGAGRRVGQRPSPGLAVQHPPRRARPRDRRVRHARQDVQGHDRRDARLADRAVHSSSRPTAPTATSCTVRPEQVVEIAFDGIQTSSRYPGGMALRFARVLRYRDDKTADEADTVETVRALR